MGEPEVFSLQSGEESLAHDFFRFLSALNL
jgi:hypothetical protein